MSAGRLKISYSAAAQIALLTLAEKTALERLFSGDEIEQPATTRSTGDGRFVSRLGTKRVLWRRSTGDWTTEILSIVDQSFAQA